MLKTVLAIVGAAFGAAAIVGLVAPPAPADAASAGAGGTGDAACGQHWPYYEPACLRDNRKRSGNAHAVRVIALANRGAPHKPQARH